jgi:hypothetical protein
VRSLLALLALLAACSREPRPPLPVGAIEICEPCVGSIGPYRIGVGNIWAREIGGKLQPAAMLSIWREGSDGGGVDQSVTVVAGSEIELGGETYRVIEVYSPKGESGSVRLLRK